MGRDAEVRDELPKDIVFIAHFAGSSRHGMVYGHYYLAKEWARQGHKVTIVSAGWAHTRSLQPDVPGAVSEEWIDGIRYIWLKTPRYEPSQRIGRVLNLLSFAAQVRFKRLPVESADIVICSSHCPFAIHGAHRLARRTNARLVFEVRDLWPLTLVELGGASTRNPLIRAMQWSEDYAYRHADKVISVLPTACSYMVSRGLLPHKFAHVPNGIDVSEEHDDVPRASGIASTLDKLKSEGRFLLGFAGRFVNANALEYLVRGAREAALPNLHLVLVGDGYLRSQITSLIAELGMQENATLVGAVNKSEVGTLLRKMDVLYLGMLHKPIYRFGVSPTKLNDYLLAAKPVIYAVNAPDDVVQAANCGITCAPEDAAAIARALRTIHAMDIPEREEMGRRGRAWLLRNRSYRKLAQDFLNAVYSV